MKKTLLLFCLTSVPLAAEPRWTAVQPRFPLIAPADSWWEVEVHGPAGEKPILSAPTAHWPLTETSPGVYRARVQPIAGDWRVDADVLGQVQVQNSSLGVLQINRTSAVFRCGPSSDYDRLTPVVAGTRLQVVGRQGDYYQVTPPNGWIRMAEGELLPPGASLGNPQLAAVSINERSQEISFQLGSPCAWQVRAEPEARKLWVDFPGAPMAMFEMAYAQNANRVPCVRLHPRAEGSSAEILLNQRLWGYSTSWEGREMKLRLTAPPAVDAQRPLRGVRIALDAGHGGSDEGTVGLELRIKEKDLNLQVTKALQQELEAAGAVVTLTRAGDREVAPDGSPAEVELQSRVDLAERHGAQLFVSIHHNARPDVRDGRLAHGTHVYYYQPQSCELARQIAAPLANAIGEPSFMHLWRSFAVIRQTTMPSVLVECNFLSNPTLEKGMLKAPDYPKKAAAGIRKGIEKFLLSDM